MRTCDILKVLMYPLGIISVISSCSIKVADIKIMENFLFSNFTNHVWKTVKYNKFPPIKGFQVLSNTDQQTVFGWRGVKPIVANTARIGVRPGMTVCFSDTGEVQFLDNNPAKMFLTYRNEKTGQTHEQNQWVLYTDYANLVILYACESVLADGSCDPDNSYIWILSKKTSLTEEEAKLAQVTANSVCIQTLNTLSHKDPCPEPSL
ncbi:retinol-binding protein 4-A-like [Crassostrea virginica]